MPATTISIPSDIVITSYSIHYTKLYDYDIVTVGEASGVTAAQAVEWVGEHNQRLSMIFQFEHVSYNFV